MTWATLLSGLRYVTHGLGRDRIKYQQGLDEEKFGKVEEMQEPHQLLGKRNGGELVLLAGPNVNTMRAMVAKAQMIEHLDVRMNNEDILRGRIVAHGISIVCIRSIPEVEGMLTRASLDPYHHLAYAADRVVYTGSEEAIQIHPKRHDEAFFIRNGRLVIYKYRDNV